MIITVHASETRDSNGWQQTADIKVDLSIAGDSTTDARAEEAIRALDAAYRKVKRELQRLARKGKP